MAPSKEAIKRAEEYITIEGAGDSTELMIGKYVFKTDKNVRIRGEVDLIQLIVATAIDDHTADLHAEVEALRAERDKNADTVTVWGWVWNEGGGMYPDSVELWDDEEYIAFDGKDWLHKAAEWVRAKESEATKELS